MGATKQMQLEEMDNDLIKEWLWDICGDDWDGDYVIRENEVIHAWKTCDHVAEVHLSIYTNEEALAEAQEWRDIRDGLNMEEY